MPTVVFDLDGTLADTSGDLLAAANACFRALGHGDMLGPHDALTALRGGKAMLRLGFSRLGVEDEERVDAQYPLLLASYASAIDTHTTVYPGVEAALLALTEAGLGLAICTNKPQELAETLMHRLGLRHHFQALVGADTLPQRKPHPAPLFEAIRRAGGKPSQALLVGDTQTDRDTGLAAGVPVVLVSFGPEGTAVAEMNPDALLDHFDDLPALALSMLGGSAG